MTPDPVPIPNSPASEVCRTTRWTLVLASRGDAPEAKLALSQLCELYYLPVFRFLRSEGRSQDETRELTQDFFAHVLGGSGFRNADPGLGRFRSYLWGALKHFLADRRKKERRLKRGGGLSPEPLESDSSEDEEGAWQLPDSSEDPPDVAFDREWALAVLGRALNALQSEFEKDGLADSFELLKPWLMGSPADLSQAAVGQQLCLSEGAVKVAIHRLRRRLRAKIRNEIAQTLREPSQVDQELRGLVEALRR